LKGENGEAATNMLKVLQSSVQGSLLCLFFSIYRNGLCWLALESQVLVCNSEQTAQRSIVHINLQMTE